MSTTPTSKSRLSCKNVKAKTDVKRDSTSSLGLQSATSTPPNGNNQADAESDYSPLYFPLTQDTMEGIDVLWDWQSPQSGQRKRKKLKRLVPAQSPKFPMKRYPSNNQSQNFERLRNELKALQEELALPDDESCLCVSPQQEIEFKAGDSNNLGLEVQVEPRNCDDSDDMFNDSIDEQLILFSQKVETDLLNNQSSEEKINFTTNLCDNTEINGLLDKYNEKNAVSKHSFDAAINTLSEESVKVSRFPFQKTFSDTMIGKAPENIIETVSGKLEFHRTRSFELAGLSGHGNLTKTTIEEIERKRLEAKAKLESKMKKSEIKSPINQCSAEEIEKKRLQALAKLEAKKLQDIVEKKRQEALKKLQVRMKNASQVKSTLTQRLLS